MKTYNKTVEEYINQIPDRWRALVQEVRGRLTSHIDRRFVESLRWGMITYEVPLEVSGPTYNKQPLSFVALAAQKHYCSLYIMAIYADPDKREQLEQAFTKHALKPDIGKSCIRFKRIEDIPLDAILTMLAECTVEDFLAIAKS